jgi:hypothetical protein
MKVSTDEPGFISFNGIKSGSATPKLDHRPFHAAQGKPLQFLESRNQDRKAQTKIHLLH